MAIAAADPPAQPVYDVNLLPLIPDGQELYLQFDGINAWVPGRFQPPTTWETLSAVVKRARGDHEARATGKRKQILHSVTGHVKPGEVLALMGPSGSGKTSLLTTLAGRVPKLMDIKGSLMFNGQPLTKSAKRRIGYVLQDDMLYESLTVHETLTFTALLRLPQAMSQAEKLERVDVVLAALGLQGCRDTIIGGPARRGVSGGERKRVSVGHELLINPSMIMLDEPTSGLDSTTAMHLISLLRALAGGNRAILTTIHQPSSRLYQQLDQLMLLSQGHVMYYGAASEVANWFSALGFPVPYGVNVADFILDLAMGEVASTCGTVTGKQAVKSMYNTYERFSFRTQGSVKREGSSGFSKYHDVDELQLVVVPSDGSANTPGASSPNSPVEPPASKQTTSQSELRHMLSMTSVLEKDASPSSASSVELRRVSSVVEEDALHDTITSDSDGPRRDGQLEEEGAVHHDVEAGVVAIASDSSEEELQRSTDVGFERMGASYFEQIRVLLIRCGKVKRFEAYSAQKVAQMLFMAVLCGLFWWQRGNKGTVDSAVDASGLIFFALLFPAMRSISCSLYTFPRDYRMLVKERGSGMYRLSAFYIARTASDFPMECVLPGLFFTICYWMGGLRPDAGIFFSSLGTCLLLVLVAQSFGLLIGGAVMDTKTGQTLSNLVIMTFMLVAGFYVHQVPVWIAWAKYVSFIYWAYDLSMKIQFAGQHPLDCSATPCVAVASLKDAMKIPLDPNAAYWPNILVLFGMLIGLRIVIYWTLRYKTSHH